MICPDCKGNVIEIRGNYYCSQCGRKIDLKSLKEHLEEKIEEVKKEEIKEALEEKPEKAEESIETKDSTESAEPPESEKKEEPIYRPPSFAVHAKKEEQFFSPSPPPPPPPSHPFVSKPPEIFETSETSKSPEAFISKERESLSSKTEIIKQEKVKEEEHKPHTAYLVNIKKLLAIVVILNILILLGIIYFFVI